MKDKRIVRRAGVAILAVILGSLIGYGLSASRLDRSSKVYAERSVTQILNAWSDQELLKRASEQFRDAVDPAELHAGFDVLSHRLGTTQSCSEARGALREEEGRPVMARYDLSCRFDHGVATVRISLIRAGSDWQILGFTIDSPSLRHGGDSPGGLQPYKNGQT
jgi:hypothetical protein